MCHYMNYELLRLRHTCVTFGSASPVSATLPLIFVSHTHANGARLDLQTGPVSLTRYDDFASARLRNAAIAPRFVLFSGRNFTEPSA